MRYSILLGIGILELFAACVLIVIGCKLPRSEAVEKDFSRVGAVSHRAESQIQLMRKQVHEVRRKDFPKMASQLRTRTHAASSGFRSQHINYEALEAMSQSLAAVAQGLESWSETLDPEKNLSAARGLGNSADFVDVHLTASLLVLAASLEQSSAPFEKDLARLLLLIQQPLDHANSRELTITFLRFATNLDLLGKVLDGEPFDSTRNGFSELEATLEIAIRQIDTVGSALYPVVTVNGFLPPTIEMRPVWPEGKRTAQALRNALAGVKATKAELDELARLSRAIVLSFDDHRQRLEASQMRVNRFVSDFDAIDTTIRITEMFAAGLQDTSRVLKMLLGGATRLRELAAGLRRTQSGLEMTVNAWPELVQAMHHSAVVLNGSRQHLDTVLAQRVQYERAMESSQAIMESAEDWLEAYSAKLDARLGDQEQSLEEMQQGLAEVNAALPNVAHAANAMLNAVRWMFWILGGLFALHGLFGMIDAGRFRLSARR